MVLIEKLLPQIPTFPDVLPAHIRDSHHLIALDTALRTIHMPEHLDDIAAAQARLRYDEAASLEAVLLQQAREHYSQSAPACPPVERGLLSALQSRLPYQLTNGQQDVFGEISADISQPHPMNRLLQGEVGSGKTVVALLAMAQAVDNGQQAVLMAPTEVLAQQHARTVTELLGELGTADQLRYADNDNQPAVQTAVTVLTGSLSTAQKRQALLDIVTGRAGIIIGTQALLQEGVEFFRLGLVVIDEQHRFGVRQRLVLTDKGANGKTPHMLVMTATPIPRTIALTSFGDLTVSSLKELPRGRAPITTAVVNSRIHPTWVPRIWQRVMKQFAAHELDVVICTTVIEVGIDVPCATVMVVVDADRFGVSQLHQLRGRVGRGSAPGLCLLLTECDPASPAATRLAAVESSTDGFYLAQVDLEQRREGDLLGTAQAGVAMPVRLLDIVRDAEIVAAARHAMEMLMGATPGEGTDWAIRYPQWAEVIEKVAAQSGVQYPLG